MGFISELIGYPLGFIMWAVYSLVKNYGIAILIFTFVVRLILFPLSVKQQKSVAAMSAFQPKLDKLKKQYANNPNKLQEEQMKLYAEENINPMASCLPMFLQLFFLYGVFDVVYRPLTHILRIGKDTIEAMKTVATPLFEGNQYFSQRPEIYIMDAVKKNPSLFDNVTNVSPETINAINGFDNMLFGIVDLGDIPNIIFSEGHVWTTSSFGLLMIPVVSFITQLISVIYSNIKQKKLNPEASAQMGSMNIMMYGMLAFSFVIAFSFPAGIGFYWICSSLVGFLQSFILHKVYTPEYVAKLVEKDKQKNKNKKRSSFMEKYNEMLKEQMQQQNGGSSNNSRIAASGVASDDDDGEEVRITKAQMKDYERKIIAEARRRQAEKYGDEYNSSDD